MTSKYDALANHLRQQSGPRHELRFAELERLIGTPLPASARNCNQGTWWSNERPANSRHVQAKNGWLAAGWEVESVDHGRETVTFRR